MHSYMLRANNYRYRSAQFVSLYPDFTVGTGILPALLKYFCCQHIRIKALGLVAQTPARITASEEFHLALKQRSRVILPFSSALLNWDSPLLREFSSRGEGVFGKVYPAIKVPLWTPPAVKVPLRPFSTGVAGVFSLWRSKVASKSLEKVVLCACLEGRRGVLR